MCVLPSVARRVISGLEAQHGTLPHEHGYRSLARSLGGSERARRRVGAPRDARPLLFASREVRPHSVRASKPPKQLLVATPRVGALVAVTRPRCGFGALRVAFDRIAGQDRGPVQSMGDGVGDVRALQYWDVCSLTLGLPP